MRDLTHFSRKAWSLIEPRKYVHGRHIEMISEHLMAVSRGEIKRLLILMPPRHMKSLLISVFWPAWHWLHCPSTQWLTTSYGANLATRDALKARTIMSSGYYFALQEYMRETRPYRDKYKKFNFKHGQNLKTRYENIFNGHRIAVSVDSGTTGEGGDILLIDDPHNVKDVESQVQRESTIDWYRESFRSRGNGPDAAIVVVGQRTHEMDLQGWILANDPSYEVLCLPATYDGEDRSHTSLNAKDWRTEEGEPLWPQQYNADFLAELRNDLGEYAAACQLDQRPAPREGGMFKVGNINIVEPHSIPHKIIKTVRYWDKAASVESGCYTAGIKVGRMDNGDAIILDAFRKRVGTDERRRRMKQVAAMDGHQVTQYIEQEGGSAGKDAIRDEARFLAGFPILFDKVTGSKETRAQPFASQVNAGTCWMLKGDWNQAFIDELSLFPNGQFKDQVDAASGAYVALFGGRKVGVLR